MASKQPPNQINSTQPQVQTQPNATNKAASNDQPAAQPSAVGIPNQPKGES